MNNQTVKPDRWIIVDDGHTPVSDDVLSKSDIPVKHIIMPKPNPRVKTHTINFRAGAKRVSDEGSIFVIDDDDYYAPTYIEKMMGYLNNGVDIVGTAREIEYSLRKDGGYDILNRARFTTNHHTAFNTKILNEVFKVIDNTDDPRMDLLVWDHIKKKTFIKWAMPVFDPYICVSFKQWPAIVNGYCKNHRKDFLGNVDKDYKYLKNLLGDDFERYSKYIH